MSLMVVKTVLVRYEDGRPQEAEIRFVGEYERGTAEEVLPDFRVMEYAPSQIMPGESRLQRVVWMWSKENYPRRKASEER